MDLFVTPPVDLRRVKVIAHSSSIPHELDYLKFNVATQETALFQGGFFMPVGKVKSAWLRDGALTIFIIFLKSGTTLAHNK